MQWHAQQQGYDRGPLTTHLKFPQLVLHGTPVSDASISIQYGRNMAMSMSI